MLTEMYKEDILNRMRLLDQHAGLEFEDGGRFHVIIVGGGALVLREYISRSTDDIDVLEATNKLYGLMEQYDMNGGVNAHIYSFPYNYEDRATVIWSGEKIDYFTASLEDIVISKICGNRDRDLEDLEKLADNIDWELLDKLANDEEELQLISMTGRSLQDFKACYENFERIYRKCKD